MFVLFHVWNSGLAYTGPSAALSIIQSAEALPALLLNLVTSSLEQLQQEGRSAAPGLALPGQALPEALPGQAPGCGELLKAGGQLSLLNR